MTSLRPLGRRTNTPVGANLEMSSVRMNCLPSCFSAAKNRSILCRPSRPALAAMCVASFPSSFKLSSRHVCKYFDCCCLRKLVKCGSSLPARAPKQPKCGQPEAYSRGRVTRRQSCRADAIGSWRTSELVRSPYCCGGFTAATAQLKTSVGSSSCSIQDNHSPSSTHPFLRPSGSWPQLAASRFATAVARLGRHPAAATAAIITAGTTGSDTGTLQPVDLDELLYTPGEEIPYYMGPMDLREVPDAGVGAFVTKDVPCGTVLMACYPLALLRGKPMGHTSSPGVPPPLELANAMDGAVMSPLAAAWMQGLYDGIDDDEDSNAIHGSDGRGSAGSRTKRRLGQLRQLFRQPFGANSAAPADDDEVLSGTAAPGFPNGVRCPLPSDAVARVVTFNAYGEARPDPAVAAARLMDGEQLSGCVGLWPPFSLINHSCAPVASYGLVGDVMVVRAATDLSAGQQVTISYFGRRALAPLELRRAYLAQHYGFICTCERCTLEEAGLEEEEEEVEEAEHVGARTESSTRRLPAELPAFIENLHATCSHAAAPHLNDMLTGRRWTATAASPGGGGINGPVSMDEPVSELVDELSELYGYLSECWQQLLRAAAVASSPGGSGLQSQGKERVEEDGEDGSGLSQQEVLWLEGSVFVLLDQLLVVLGALGLLRRVQEEYEHKGAKEAAVAIGRREGSAGGANELSQTKKAATGEEKEDVGADVVVVAEVDEGEGDRSGTASAARSAPPPPLTAAAAMRAVASRRWRVEELPASFLMQYVDLLAQAQEVATAVAPGSDLAVACGVRLLYGIQAALGPESDEFQQAEISCYDALSARYGILDFDVYEQILDVCAGQYCAHEVRLPGLGGEAAAAAAATSSPTAPASFLLDAAAEAGGMVGLQIPAVPVEAEVVE